MAEALKNGLGFETASYGELFQALKVGTDPKRIVFDSPAKTKKEIIFALEKGVYLNADNMQELEVIDKVIKGNSFGHVNVGVRINTQVGMGTIKEMSVSGSKSKFGVALKDYRDEIFQAFERYSWLNGLHIHVGSQGVSPEMTVAGIRSLVDLGIEINKKFGKNRFDFIDIGGGLAVNFDSEEEANKKEGGIAWNFPDFVQLLRQNVPELFGANRLFATVFTEFGRRFNAKPGFIVSRVEYTKQSGGELIAIQHGGADLFVRTVWAPTKWALRISVLDAQGHLKQDKERVRQDIAGPCCHGGDIIAHERLLPRIAPGDHVIAHDTGAYFLSTYSYYNSRQAPAIYGYHEADPSKLILLKKPHSVEQTMAFFD
jgi:diaminopimelate decarboxylase